MCLIEDNISILGADRVCDGYMPIWYFGPLSDNLGYISVIDVVSDGWWLHVSTCAHSFPRRIQSKMDTFSFLH